MLFAQERQAALDCAFGAAQPDRQAHFRNPLTEEIPKLVVVFVSPAGSFAAHDYPINVWAIMRQLSAISRGRLSSIEQLLKVRQ
jgi:hypothetical protein